MSITRINTNPEAIMAGAQLRKLEFDMSRTMSHLATGLSVAGASDNPSALGVIGAMESQYRGTNQAIKNAEDTLSMLNVVDSAFNEVMELLQKGHEIAIRASNDATLNTQQINGMELDWANIRDEIDNMANRVVFNGKNLLSGALQDLKATIGPNGQQVYLSVQSLSSTNTTIFGVDMSTAKISTNATTAAGIISGAIQSFANYRANVGSQMREVENVIITLQSTSVNMASAMSRVKDANMATEIAEFTKQQIIAQAGTAMLAQANSQPQLMLSLLGGM